MILKDLISPLYVWKRAFQKPYTIPQPIEDREGSMRYRGFHKNDIEKCIGCGSCEEICQNGAIDMVPVESIETTKTDSGLRPKVDYGRCCWCALCVDICTTDSLSLSNVYTWVGTDPDEFRFIPGVDKKDWDNAEKGYRQSEHYNLLIQDQQKMDMEDPSEGIKSFIEMMKGYSKEQALKEADRCVECGLCVASCPGHMDIPDYIKAIREDRLEDAIEIVYRTNPLPATCGRICTRKCEEACSLAINGEPVAIRWLKRYILDNVSDDQVRKIIGEEFQDNGKKVAIIGAGPGGLSAAYYLKRLGYSITIFEANDNPGGMIYYGVPEYRMPFDQLANEISNITKDKINIKFNTKVGRDIEFQKIYDDFDAILISTGLTDPYAMRLVGEELQGVISGLEFLDDVARGKEPEIGNKVAVIGGGNVAIDAARTSRRLGADVDILYRRRKIDMPADDEEIHDADLEKVNIVTQAIPVHIEKADKGLDLTWGEAEMVDQGEGKRPKPVIIKGKTHTNNYDTIISAIGQGADFSFLPASLQEKIEIKWGSIITNDLYQTGDPKIFASGDIVNSTKDAISAIADGHYAANGIDKYLLKQ